MSFLVLIICTVCFSYVGNVSGADDISYLGHKTCSSDLTLNTSFKHIVDFTQ
jgi:hypothetical protein